MLLIGSQALKIIAPDLLDREPKDYDLIGFDWELKSLMESVKFTSMKSSPQGGKIYCLKEDLKPVEFEIAWEGSSAEMLLNMPHEKYYVKELGLEVMVPSLDVLLAIKESHRFRKNTVHFVKNRVDYLKLKAAGVTVVDNLKEFVKLREAETYTYAHPKLSTSKGEFFNPKQVTYVYDHDSIHLAMAYPLAPAYQSFQTAEVFCSRSMFEAQPFETQLRSVMEECYVLSLERSQVPFPGRLTPRRSFLVALEKVCTSIASGWWREFAYTHYDQALALYSDEYMQKFADGLANGIIQLAKTPELVGIE
jgi:hypothetical protein